MKKALLINLKSIFVFGFVITLFSLNNISIPEVNAQYSVIETQDLKIEKTTYRETKEYISPKMILLIPINRPSGVDDMTSLDWYRGINYYQTSRYNLPALTFHYVVTYDGQLIKNDDVSSLRKISLTNNDIDSPIVIGYLNNSEAMGFKPNVRGSIKNIILDIMNDNEIPPEKVMIKNLKFVETKQREFQITAENISIMWQKDFEKIVEELKIEYKPTQKVFTAEVTNLILPTAEQEADALQDVQIKVKNTSKFPIYGGTENSLILTKIAPKNVKTDLSVFYVKNEWPTQSQVKIMQDNDILMPNEEKDYKFKIHIPLVFGDVSENFQITNIKGSVLNEKPVVIKAKVKRSDAEVIEILPTDFGYLKVRAGDGFDKDEVTRVSTGERFKVLEKSNGWFKIRVDESKVGWVYSKYVKKV